MPMTQAERAKRYREKTKMAKAIERTYHKPGGVEDLAEMVVEKAKAGLADGTLTPQLKDGLAAQKILDSRARAAEKQEDVKLIVGIFRLLAGDFSAPVALIEDGNTVEGSFEEVSDAHG